MDPFCQRKDSAGHQFNTRLENVFVIGQEVEGDDSDTNWTRRYIMKIHEAKVEANSHVLVHCHLGYIWIFGYI